MWKFLSRYAVDDAGRKSGRCLKTCACLMAWYCFTLWMIKDIHPEAFQPLKQFPYIWAVTSIFSSFAVEYEERHP